MTDQTPKNATNTEEEKTFSDSIEDLLDALECLYVIDNLSGRLQFRKNWPPIAPLIFPANLMHIDEFGSSDKPYRTKLEEEADTIRIGLIEKIKSIQEEHHISGALNAAKTKTFIEELGKDAAAHIFQQHIIQKLCPTLASVQKTEPAPKSKPTPKAPPKPAEPTPETLPEKISYKTLFNTAAQSR